MSLVAGIDASSRAVDVVLLDETTDRAEWHRFELAGGTPFERARSVPLLLPRASFWDDVYLVGLEQSYSVTFNAATALALVRGALAAALPTWLTILETPPNEWQRVFLGVDRLTRDRKARKAMIRRRAVELGFGDAPDMAQDAYDAYGVAWAVRAINRRAVAASEAA